MYFTWYDSCAAIVVIELECIVSVGQGPIWRQDIYNHNGDVSDLAYMRRNANVMEVTCPKRYLSTEIIVINHNCYTQCQHDPSLQMLSIGLLIIIQSFGLSHISPSVGWTHFQS